MPRRTKAMDRMQERLEEMGYQVVGEFWTYRGPFDAGEARWGVDVIPPGQTRTCNLFSSATMTACVRAKELDIGDAGPSYGNLTTDISCEPA